ncbi:9278_t:CDS:2 [Diversispora eburnea]|uniref:9278_t:CDS:1 n=1 Tax=Diversispora eburnea TaxID=1213867 RepID=A0A9N8YQX6_9GLOM|nr:9278_t:CDS:2 [Diversispora eburnea]
MAQQKNPVILPAKGQHWETNSMYYNFKLAHSFGDLFDQLLKKYLKNLALIQFGSINQPSTNLPLSSSPIQPPLISGGSHPPPLPKSGTPTFGTVTTRSSEELVQPTPTQPVVASSGPGAVTGAPRLATRIQNEIPRTHSAPPQLNLQDSINVKNVGQQSSHQSITTVPPHRTQPVPNVQQLSAASSHQQPTPPTSNPTPHHRKDSISSNDGQQIQTYHPHQPQPQPHHNNHNPPNQQHAHTQYHQHSRPHSHIKPSGGMGPGSVQGVQQYHPRRDKNGHPHITSAQQTVPTQAQMAMTGQPTMPIQLGFYRSRPQHSYNPAPYTPSQPKSKAVPIINPTDKTVVKPTPTAKPIPLGNSTIKKDETPVSVAVDVKKHDDADKEKENHIPDADKKESRAVPIVNPIYKEKEREEKERREREEKERLEREERERKEREERERIEREERERKEREEKERKEREEKERIEREEKERIEKERKEREERERKEREEKERIERERKEREERERKEREEKERIEREERARIEKEEKEREERERKEREEKERKEREEKERKEREERERIEKEEKERKEREEREERERKEREEREEAERLRKEKEEKEEKERQAREELEKVHLENELARQAEKKRLEEENVKAEAEEAEKKKETESKEPKDKKYGKGNKPGPLDLSLSRTASAPALGSALLSARRIEDLTAVTYPANIQSPKNSEPGKYKYDRGFLMQFMTVCKDKPENLPTDVIAMEEAKDDKKRGTRANSRPTQHSKGSPNQTTQYAQMGEFKFTPKTSEERFLASTNTSSRSISSTGSFGSRSTLGPRTGSGSTILPPMMNIPQSPGRNSSNTRRNTDKHGKKGIHQSQQGQNMGQEPVPPLEMTENRWVPVSVSNQHNKSTDDFIPMETVQRKVKALLNKLTLEKFDSISDQIIDFANKSRDEREGRILKEVIRLTFEKSCDEPNFSQMYAQLCRKMMERIDVEIIDENVKNADGKFVQGGTLFRKYLLNRCQEDFEKGWKVNVPLPSNEKGEPDLMSDEYYTAAKAKRHGLGLIRFIGELFKLNMLTERIMHECIKKLLTVSGNPETPEEEEMESLCKLLTTVGQQLDHEKAKTHMDTYFSRMEDISRNPKISSRIRFMLQASHYIQFDVIELRNNNWIPRRDNNAPKTIAEIHEDAAKQKEDEFMRRTASSGGRGLPKMADQMTRVGSGRRDHRDKSSSGGQSLDGWSTVSGSSSRKAGDLSKFGSVSRSKVSGPVSLAPGGGVGAFTGGSKGWKTENKDREDKASSMARANSTSNLYSVLTHADTERKSFEGPTTDSPKASPPAERKKLILHPRSIQESNVAPKPTTAAPSPPQPSLISEEVAERKINNMIAEYFNVLDIQEVILCVKDLPNEYHSKVVSSFANKVLEKKQDDVRKVIEMFDRVMNEGVLTKKEFIDGLAVTIEFLIDIGADAPKSYTFTGQLLFTARFDLKEVTEILKPLLDDVKGTEKVVAGYIEEWKREIDEQSIARKVKDSGFDFKLIFPHSDINKSLESIGLETLKK